MITITITSTDATFSDAVGALYSGAYALAAQAASAIEMAESLNSPVFAAVFVTSDEGDVDQQVAALRARHLALHQLADQISGAPSTTSETSGWDRDLELARMNWQIAEADKVDLMRGRSLRSTTEGAE